MATCTAHPHPSPNPDPNPNCPPTARPPHAREQITLEKGASYKDICATVKKHADGPLKGILGYEERPLVSCDYVNDARSSIVDAPSTMVVNGTQVKIYAWYDNEWGYAHRLADVAMMVGKSL